MLQSAFLVQERQCSQLMIVQGICNRCQHHLNQLSTGNSYQASAPVQGNPRHGPRGLPLPQPTFDSSSSSHWSMAQIANSSSSTSQEMSATNTPSHTDTSGRDQELNNLQKKAPIRYKELQSYNCYPI